MDCPVRWAKRIAGWETRVSLQWFVDQEIIKELDFIEKEARETDRALQKIFKQLGVGA